MFNAGHRLTIASPCGAHRGHPRTFVGHTRMRFERTLDRSLCFEVFASERARATFPQLYRSFSFQEELRTDNDLRVYCPGFDRPNPHYRFTHLALQPWMGIRTSRGHWHRFPDVAGHDVDRTRTWDRRFLASITVDSRSQKSGRTSVHCCDAHRVRPLLGGCGRAKRRSGNEGQPSTTHSQNQLDRCAFPQLDVGIRLFDGCPLAPTLPQHSTD